MSTAQFDVIVIGAGAGGLFTAARLAHRGYRTLVVERLDKVGGRASTDDIDGFKVNNGAIVIEVGGITQQTCEEVGAPFDIREPKPPLLYRIGGKDVDVTGGGWGLLLEQTHPSGRQVGEGYRGGTQRLGLTRRRDLHSRMGFAVHEKRTGAWHLPQHVRLDLRRGFRGSAGAGVPHLLHPQKRVQTVRVPPGGHHRVVARPGERHRVPRWSGVAVHAGRQDRFRRRHGRPACR